MTDRHPLSIKPANLHWRQAGLIALCGLLALLSDQYQSPAIAQTHQTQIAQQYPQQQKRRTLLDILFGNARQQPPQEIQPRQAQQPQRRTLAPVKKKPVISKAKPVVAAPASASTPVQRLLLEAPTKNPDAKNILIIGDFIAGGLAEGLNETFLQAPDLQVINRSNGSSGFVRQDYYNWSRELPAILAEQKPAVIVMMIGANDRQPMTQNKRIIAPDTDEWKTLYQSRIDEFMQVAAKSGIPLVWIGQPPYKHPALSQTMLTLNAFYKNATEQTAYKNAAAQTGYKNAAAQAGATPGIAIANASFIDVWDGFVDDKGGFTQTGVDVSGQTMRLRGSDGINMSSAGKRKLAFYAEKPLRQLLKRTAPDRPAGEFESPPADLISNELMALPVPKQITRIGPMKLSDLDQSSDDKLLGNTPTAGKSMPAHTGAHQGRADDFRWPR